MKANVQTEGSGWNEFTVDTVFYAVIVFNVSKLVVAVADLFPAYLLNKSRTVHHV